MATINDFFESIRNAKGRTTPCVRIRPTKNDMLFVKIKGTYSKANCVVVDHCNRTRIFLIGIQEFTSFPRQI